MSKPGSNIRQLARDRSSKAILNFAAAGGLLITPLLVSVLLPIALGIKVLAWVVCLVGVAILYQKGQKLWIKAKQADQGAQGEENVAQLLDTLKRKGWTIEYNIPLKHWGDADAFLYSTKGNYFVIDTKSNKGGVFFDGTVLKRRYGKDVYEFNGGKDLLKAVRGQAASLKKMKQINFVQPILCFTQANLREIEQDKEINGVYVVDLAHLLSSLDQLDTKRVL